MQFVCRVGTPDGRLVTESFEAHSEPALRLDLEKRGYQVFDVRSGGTLGRLSLPSFKKEQKRLPIEDLLIFNQELMALLRAGLPLLQSLDLMLERQRDSDFRAVLGEIRERVKSGEDLSDAVASFGDMFPPLYPSTLKAGERTGELDAVISRFIRNQRLMLDARKRMVSALVYPILLICLSLGLILVMTIYVVPKFEDFYAGLNAELPAVTRGVMAVSVFLRDNWKLLIAVLVVGAGFFVQWRRSESARELLGRWKISIPFLGRVFHRMALSEFGRSLATLLSGGIPLVDALGVSVQAVDNVYISKKMAPTIGKVREGESLHESLEETGVFPDLGVDMVKVGEATGALDEMISNLSDFFDTEVETRLQRLLTLIEPVMMVVMGVLVATLLVAVYLPLIAVLRQVNF